MNREQELEQIISTAKIELNEIRLKKHISKYEDLIGKCFKYDNGYNKTERWTLYYSVHGVVNETVVCKRFEKSSRGEIKIDFNHKLPFSRFESEEYILIRGSEFVSAWNELIAEINNK